MLTLGFAEAENKAKGPWQKGRSGNPGGRPRRGYYDGPSITELARTYTPDAVKALALALHHPATRVPAAVALLDRGWGKPDINVHTKSEQTVLHLIAAQAISEEILSSVRSVSTQIEGTVDDANELPKE